MMKEFVVFAGIVLVVLAAGCTSAPVKESSNQVRFVELVMLDGTKAGGQYVSETAAFVTIIPLYVLDKNGFMTPGNGKPTSVKTSMISIMTTIEDPKNFIDTTMKAQAEKAAANAEAERLAQEQQEKARQAEKARYEAEIAKRQPTKKSSNS